MTEESIADDISPSYSHQIRAAVNSTNLTVVNEKEAAWNDLGKMIPIAQPKAVN